MKKNKGFTLIELLAVIVILAIIALIATPVIMNIIKTSRENSAIESAKLYIKSLQAVVTQKKLEDHNYNLTTCTEPTCGGFTIVTDDTMPESVNLMFEKEKLQANSTMKIMGYNLVYDGRKWVIKDEIADACKGYERVLKYDILPTCTTALNGLFGAGSDALCTGGKFYDMYTLEDLMNSGYKGMLIEAGAISNVRYEQGECIAPNIFNKTANESKTNGTVPTGSFTPGDEYIIGPGDGFGYHFYVLSDNQDGTVNLITSENLAESEWISQEDYNDDTNYGDGNTNKGPITAMNTLYTATQNWTNIPNIVMNYRDENINEDTLQEADHEYGYDGIYTTGNTTIIKSADGSTTASYTNLKARLLTAKEVLDLGCSVGSADDALYTCPEWLYLDQAGLPAGNGIWALSSGLGYGFDRGAWGVDGEGYVSGGYTVYMPRTVRPVITVPKTSLQ